MLPEPSKEDGRHVDRLESIRDTARTRNRALRSDPLDNAVIALSVGAVRAIPGQTVIHSPVQGVEDIPDNRAHAEVFGPKNAETRVSFLRSYQLVLMLESR